MENRIIAVVVTYNPNLRMLDEEYNSIVGQVNKLIYVDNYSNNHNELFAWAKNKRKLQFVWLKLNEGLGSKYMIKKSF